MENKTNETKIIFLGTPEFALPSLEALVNNFSVVAVVTNSNDTPIKKYAEENKIPVFFKLDRLPYADLYVIVAYGKIIPKSIFNIPRLGIINVHASILPRWRGASPIQYTILNGDKKAGVTIINITEKVDQGPILSQQEILLDQKETAKTLSEKLSKIGAELLIKTIKDYFNPAHAGPMPQNESEATYTKIITKEDGHIIWSKKAEEIERQIRAFDFWPGSFTFFSRNEQLLRLKILKADINLEIEKIKDADFGRVLAGLIVKTGQGTLKIKELQLEGGRILKATEFLAGYPEIIGQVLM